MVVALLVGTSVAGCGDRFTERRAAYEQEQQRERALDDLGRQPVWTGTVAAFDAEAIFNFITFDYGGRYPTDIQLARIRPIECDLETDREYRKAFVQRLSVTVPAGAKFALVRSTDRGGDPEDSGFLHYLTPEGRPDMSRPTVNEEMVATGLAEPDPEVELRSSGSYEPTPLPQVVDQNRELMSDLDFGYWERFVRAFVEADERREATAGACAEKAIQDRQTYLREAREAEERYRRLELGPDGRRGTADDFSDYDGDGRRDNNGSSSGGGFDVPDSLCPTRFC